MTAMMKLELDEQKLNRMSKDDELLAAKTRRQVDDAVSWLEKRYFTEEVKAKKHLNESATQLVEGNKIDKKSSID